MSKKRQISKKTVNDNEGTFVVFAAIVLLVAVVVFFVIMPTDNTHSGGGGDIEWEVDETETVLKINGSGDMENYSGGEAPWYEYRNKITGVELSKGLTSIGDHAFDNFVKLNKIGIPSTVKRIGHGAFFNCKMLVTINIPSGVEEICNNVFSKCVNLNDVNWEEKKNIKKIGDYAFFQCGALDDTFDFAEFTSLETIGEYAFDHCDNATFILNNMPNSVAVIGKSAFYNVNVNGTVVFGTGLKQLGDEAFRKCCSITNVDMSKCTYVSLGKGTFCDCEELVNITLFQGITEIPDNTFSYCVKLVSVSFPSTNDAGDVNLTGISLGEEAFYYCYNLADGKTLTIGGDGVKIGERCFGGKCGMDAQYIIVKTDVRNLSFDSITFYDKTPNPMDMINGTFVRNNEFTYNMV